MMKALFSSAYWPNLHYFYYLLNSDGALIEQFDHYDKQSFRNRCEILSANGKLSLSLPVKNLKAKEIMKEVRISYAENWQSKHWRALSSAYKNSPYFEFFEDEIKPFYTQQTDLLLDYNNEQIKTVLNILRIKKELHHTSAFEKNKEGVLDLREKIHPKVDFTNDPEATGILKKTYYQTFEEKFDFIPNLSILDLLFNKGLDTIFYLKH